MISLLLSLGHGASAICIEDGEIICGYENERLTKIKSDSKYPIAAINEVGKHCDLFEVDEILVSHWFVAGILPKVPNKYFNQIHLLSVCPKADIKYVNIHFTHHDAHLHSAMLFAGPPYMTKENLLGIVCDGFGTMGETLSIYNFKNGTPSLWRRSFGFSSSLGLLYQYATSYLGMKENQDEFKLLGYEVKISTLLTTTQLNTLNTAADIFSKKLLKDISTYDIRHKFDPLCSIDALPALKLHYRKHFDTTLRLLGLAMPPNELALLVKKIIISYYVQRILEVTMISIVSAYAPTHLLLSGGVFMNVKLNRLLAGCVKGKTCIMPLCGDQGAPLGLYQAMHPWDMVWPDHLNWGIRKFDKQKLNLVPGIRYINNTIEYTRDIIVRLLNDNKIVNLVRGNMEFGSRALCNTSTLATPTKDNVSYINTINGRDTIMPMAPVMSRRSARNKFYLAEIDRIHKSHEYMVCTAKYARVHDTYAGVTHVITPNIYSGRPQITDDPLMLLILTHGDGILINTSFNIHGVPIVFDTDDIITCHNYQKRIDVDDRVVTIVLGD